MALTSVTKILNTIKSERIVTRTLDERFQSIEFLKDDSGEIFYRVGNSVVLFKILLEGRVSTLRCYMRKTKYLEQIYGEKYLSEELYIFSSSNSGCWIDVVIAEWVDGQPLSQKIEEAVNANDTSTLTTLADNFDRLSVELLEGDWAHGDLTTENIIVTPSQELKLIDFDGKFLPEFMGYESVEIGTAAFQSPLRTTLNFDKNIDDYSIALISTSLRALSVEPQIYRDFYFRDGLIIDPQAIFVGKTKALDYITKLFFDNNMNSAFRIAKFLYSPNLHIVQLFEILSSNFISTPINTPLFMSINHGFVGYSNLKGEIFIPHIYDDGLEFRRGNEVMVNLNGKWMIINYRGEVIREV